jgi:hypothetical protein
MIDCISTCIAGLLHTSEESSQSRNHSTGSPNHRDNSQSIFRSFDDSKHDIDSSSNSSHYLLDQEDRASIELERQEHIQRYTSDDLLYKQPIDNNNTKDTKDGSRAPECVMWCVCSVPLY